MQEYRLHDGQMVTARRKLQKPNARMRRQVSGKLWLEFEGKEPVVIPVLSLKYHVTIYIYIYIYMSIGWNNGYYLQHLRAKQTIL